MSSDSLSDSLRALDWKQCLAALSKLEAKLGWSPERMADHFLCRLSQSGALVSERPDPVRADRRTLFLSEASAWLAHRSVRSARDLEGQAAGAARVENCFHAVLATLGQSKAFALGAHLLAWALVERFAARIQIVRQQLRSSLEAEDSSVDPLTHRVQDDFGNAYRPDSVIQTEAVLLTGTLQMLAYGGNWFDREGSIRLPPHAATSTEQRDLAGIAMHLGDTWSFIDFTQAFWRHFGGQVAIAREEVKGTEASTTVQVQLDLTEDRLCRVSHHRLERMLAGFYLELSEELNDQHEYKPGSRCAEPPDGWLSFDERFSVLSLSQLLSFSVVDDQVKRAGLSLWQWCRCYSYLKQVDMGADGRLVLRLSRDAVIHDLERVGIGKTEAEQFLRLACLSKSTSDVLDGPILSDSDGSLWLLCGLASAASIPLVVLSLLSSQRETIGEKGAALERVVRNLVHEKTGQVCRGVTFTHENEVYEIDAACVWGDALLVFECKNTSLPPLSPGKLREFLEDQEAAVRQVQRLVRGVEARPDVISERLGRATWTRIVPCVLNGLPWSRPVRADGVHTYDLSALGRFFKGPVLQYVLGGSSPGGGKAVEHRLWTGASPTVDDLLAEMKDPIQVRVVAPMWEKEGRRVECASGLWIEAETHVLRAQRLAE